jgi:hypothetical protein
VKVCDDGGTITINDTSGLAGITIETADGKKIVMAAAASRSPSVSGRQAERPLIVSVNSAR